MRNVRYLFLSIVFVLSCFNPVISVSQESDRKASRISILTVSPGEDVYSVFGHTALRVKGLNGNKDLIYNYGTFSFDQPNFLTNFLRGRLLYSLSRTRFDRFLFSYHTEKRSIFEQTIYLTAEEEKEVIRALNDNYIKENRDYLYEFFFDNCTTRLRDLFSNTYGTSLQWKEQAPRYTFRQLLHQYTVNNAWLTFGIDLLVGTRTDRLATIQEEMFLPDYLYRHLNDATVSGKPAVSSDYLVLDFSAEDERRKRPGIQWPLYLFVGLLILEVIILLSTLKTGKRLTWVHIYDKITYVILGIGGIILLMMWFLTDHFTTKYNWNTLWLSPLYLGLVMNRYSKVFNYGVLFLCFLTGIAAFFQGFNVAVWPLIGVIVLKITRNIILPSKV